MKREKKIRLALFLFFLCGVGFGSPIDTQAVTTLSGSESNDNLAEASENATAVGDAAKAYGVGSVAVGKEAVAGAKDATSGAVSGNGSIAIGSSDGSASGAGAVATGEYAIALGSASSAGASQAIALGYSASAVGVGSISIGDAVAGSAKNGYAIAVGTNALADGTNAIAIGGDAKTANATKASGTSAIALGNEAKALKSFSIAIGYAASATEKDNTTAVGAKSTASGDYATALGMQAKAYKNYSVALGNSAIVGGVVESVGGVGGVAVGYSADTVRDYGVALGTNTLAKGVNAIAIGGNQTFGAGNAAYAEGAGAIALGNQAQATLANAVAIGVGSVASQNAVALGQGSVADVAGTVSVGSSAKTGGFTRRIVNVSNGTGNTDAAAYGQLVNAKATIGEGENPTTTYTPYEADAQGIVTVETNDGATAFQIKMSAGGDTYVGSDTVSVKKEDDEEDYTLRVQHMAMSEDVDTALTTATGKNAMALGVGASASGDNAAALGYGSQAEGEDTSVIGSGNTAKGIASAAIGTMNMATPINRKYAGVLIDEDQLGLNAAVGVGNMATGAFYSTAVGIQNQATSAAAVAFGSRNFASGEEAIAFGSYGIAKGAQSVVLGYFNRADGAASVAIGNDSSAVAAWATAIGVQAVASVEPIEEDGRIVANVSFGHKETDINPETTSPDNDEEGIAFGTTLVSRLTYVAEGISDTDAVNFSQIKTNAGTYIRSSLSDDGTLDKKGTVGENLKALDTKIGKEKTPDKSLYAASADVETQIYNVAGKAIKSVTNANSGGASETQKAVLSAYDGTDWSIEIAGKGEVASGDKRLVNGGTVHDAIAAAVADSAYDGSDTIAVKDKKISVVNMAMSTTWTGTAAPTAPGNYAFAIGGDAKATGTGSVALGLGAEATWTELPIGSSGDTGGTIAIGSYAKASGNGSAVVGASAQAAGEDAVAFGSYANAAGQDGTAVGTEANASKLGATAIGGQSEASGERASSFGTQSKAKGAQSAAFGNESKATESATLAAGGLSEASGIGASAVGYWSKAMKTHDTALGNQSVADAGGATALGTWSHAYGVASGAIGYQSTANASATAGTAIGYQSVAKTPLTKEGNNLVATVSFGHADGDSYTTVNATGEHVSAVYSGALLSRLTNVADGKANTDAATYGQLVKNKNYTFTDGVATIETNASTDTDEKTAFTLTLAGGKIDSGNGGYVTGDQLYTELRNVTSTHYIRAGNTAAANLSALDTAFYGLNAKVGALETDVGKIQTTIGNVKLLTDELSFDFSGGKTEDTQTINYTDGNGTAKTFTVKMSGISGSGSGTEYAAGDGIAVENKKIFVKVAEKSGLFADENGLAVKLAENGGLTADDNGLAVSKDGEVKKGNSGIVTGGAVYDAILVRDGDITKLSAAGLGDNLTDSVLAVNDKIGGLSADINKAGAGAAALAALHPEEYDPSDKWSFAVGYGHYKNANAGALGAFFKPNADTTLSVGGTIGNGDAMMNAGVSFKLGSRSDKVAYHTDGAVLRELVSLRKSNDRLTEQNAVQQKEISALRQDNEKIKADNEKIRKDNERMQKQMAMILSKVEMSDTIKRRATE